MAISENATLGNGVDGSIRIRPLTVASGSATSRRSLMSSLPTVTFIMATACCAVVTSVRKVYSPGVTFVKVKVPSGRTDCPFMELAFPLDCSTWRKTLPIGLPSASTTVPSIRTVLIGDIAIARSPIVWPAATVNRCASASLVVPGKNVTG